MAETFHSSYSPDDLQPWRLTALTTYSPDDLQPWRPTALTTYSPDDLPPYSPDALQPWRPTALTTYRPDDLTSGFRYRISGYVEICYAFFLLLPFHEIIRAAQWMLQHDRFSSFFVQIPGSSPPQIFNQIPGSSPPQIFNQIPGSSPPQIFNQIPGSSPPQILLTINFITKFITIQLYPFSLTDGSFTDTFLFFYYTIVRHWHLSINQEQTRNCGIYVRNRSAVTV